MLSRSNFTLSTSPVSPSELGQLVDAVTSQRVTNTEGKTLLGDFVASVASGTATDASFGQALAALLSTRPEAASSPASQATSGTSEGSSADASLVALVDDIIASHPDEVGKIRRGQLKVVKRLVGESMKRSKGRADAKQVEALLLGKLAADS